MSRVKAYNSGNGGWSNNTWAAAPLNSEVYDDAGFHDNATNNSRFTVPSGHAGQYIIVGHFIWDDHATGVRGLGIYKNGSVTHADIVEAIEATGVGNQMTITEILDLAVGDYVEMFAYQTSGAGLFNAGTISLAMQKLP